MAAALVTGSLLVWASLARPAGAESRPHQEPEHDVLDGFVISASSRGDIEEFRQMLVDGLGDSATFQRVLAEIGGETDLRSAVRIVLARNARGVVIDSYSRSIIDLEDLERMPSAHDAGLLRNEITREESIVHVLAERRHAARSSARLRYASSPTTRELLFDAAHEVGMIEENNYRAERGQTAVVSAIIHAVKDAADRAVIEYMLADGTSELIVTSHHGQIDRIVPPAASSP